MNESEPVLPKESLVNRLRLVLWIQHQPYIAGLLLGCLIAMPAYFVYQSWSNQGLIDIDTAAPLQATFQVDINQAEWGELVVLPGVGKKLAHAIIQHRDQAGPFQSPTQLLDVPGIGPKKLAQIKPFLLPLRH